jgi:hypothetical protein
VLLIFLHYELSIFAYLSVTETGGLHATIFHVRISEGVRPVMSYLKKRTLTSKSTAAVGYVVIDFTFLAARHTEFPFRILGENVT